MPGIGTAGTADQKGEMMSPDYAKQREALADLSVAYMSAQDFTRRVLCTAFGNVALGNVPPPSECVWPPNITQAEADSRLRAVQRFLAQSEALFKNVLREIEAAQVRLVASGFDVPRSWLIIDPLDTIKGGYLGACSVTEIVKSAPAEDAALENVLGEIEIDMRLLEGKIAAEPDEGKGNGGNKTASPPDPEDPDRYAALSKLQPAHRKAYLSFLYAEAKTEKRLEDRDAYDWLKENGIDSDKEEDTELTDYELPSFDTWGRQLREARRATGEQKYTPRRAKVSGRSIVKGTEVEQQHGDDD